MVVSYIAGRVDGNTEDMAIDQAGRLWFAVNSDFMPHGGVRRGGVSWFDPNGDGWTHASRSSPVFEEDVLAVAFDPAGNAWFGMFDGVARRAADGEWTTWRTESSADHPDNVRAIAFDSSGTGWFGTAARGIFIRDRDGTWGQRRDLVFLEGVRVWDVEVDTADQVWIASSARVVCVEPDGRVTRHVAAPGGLIHDRVHVIAVDPEGQLWFGTRGGASLAQ